MKFFILTIIILFSFLKNFAFGEIPQSDKIIAYYAFSGNANDSSGNGYDGTISGDPQLTTDRFGNSNSAYSFDGDGDWIYFGTDTEIGFILAPIHFLQIMGVTLVMLLPLVFGLNHLLIQQWTCLLMVEWLVVEVVDTVQS